MFTKQKQRIHFSFIVKNFTQYLAINCILILLSSFNVSAQTLLKANDPSIAYASMHSEHYFSKVTVCDLNGRVQLEFVNENKRTVDSLKGTILFARSRSVPFGKLYVDSSVTGTSGPISFAETTFPLTKQVSVSFGPKKVLAHAMINGKAADSSVNMEEGYFDDNIIADMFGYLPIQKGVRYHLNAYRFESKGGQNPYEVYFAFEDLIQEQSGKIRLCNVLYFENSYQHGYCWIDPLSRMTFKEVIYGKNTIVLVQVI